MARENRLRLPSPDRRIASLAILCCLSGCAELLRPDYYTDYHQPPKNLREIETVKLEELSRTPPVSVDQATKDAGDHALADRESPEFLELNLAEVRAAALANNLDLQVELVNPSIGRETVGEEEARFEALVFGSATLERTDTPSRVVGGRARQSQSTRYNAGVRIPLRTGGTVTVELPVSKFDDKSISAPTPPGQPEVINPAYDAGLRFSISQPLLRDAGIRTNTHFIRIAKFERDIADARTKLEAIRILANADRAYWLLYAARRELGIRQDQYELALEQLEQAGLRVAAGDAPEIEIMRADSGVARRLEAIIIADTIVRRRERDLKRIMNRDDLPIDSPTAIHLLTDPNPVGIDLDADALAEFAVENRMEMLELELRLAADASTVDFERNGKLPLFVLDYSYTINGVSNSFNGALREIGGHRFADNAVMLTAEIPFGNLRAKSRLRRALLERIQRLASRAQRRLAIRQEVYDAVDALEQDWQRILAARQEVVLAGRTYEAEKRQFEVGLRTSTDVLLEAARLADAQSREIRALVAYEISQVDIAFASGTLIGKGRVIWEPITLEP